MDVSLVMFKADGARREFPLKKKRVIIGRINSCDLRIPLSSVSRQHCEIRLSSSGSVKIRDLGSSNGTFLNDKRITEGKLKAGDNLVIGPVVFTVVIDGKPAEIEPTHTVLPGKDEKAQGVGTQELPLNETSQKRSKPAKPQPDESLAELELVPDESGLDMQLVDDDGDDAAGDLAALAAAGSNQDDLREEPAPDFEDDELEELSMDDSLEELALDDDLSDESNAEGSAATLKLESADGEAGSQSLEAQAAAKREANVSNETLLPIDDEDDASDEPAPADDDASPILAMTEDDVSDDSDELVLDEIDVDDGEASATVELDDSAADDADPFLPVGQVIDDDDDLAGETLTDVVLDDDEDETPSRAAAGIQDAPGGEDIDIDDIQIDDETEAVVEDDEPIELDASAVDDDDELEPLDTARSEESMADDLDDIEKELDDDEDIDLGALSEGSSTADDLGALASLSEDDDDDDDPIAALEALAGALDDDDDDDDSNPDSKK